MIVSLSTHINFVYDKLIKFTGIFYKLRSCMHADTLRMLYYAFVYPHILYEVEFMLIPTLVT